MDQRTQAVADDMANRARQALRATLRHLFGDSVIPETAELPDDQKVVVSTLPDHERASYLVQWVEQAGPRYTAFAIAHFYPEGGDAGTIFINRLQVPKRADLRLTSDAGYEVAFRHDGTVCRVSAVETAPSTTVQAA